MPRLSFLLLLLPLVAAAEAPNPPTGTQTRAWMAQQVSGQSAEGEARPMDGEAANAAYQRYLESFKHPIPETLSAEQGGSSGASASGSGEGGGSSR